MARSFRFRPLGQEEEDRFDDSWDAFRDFRAQTVLEYQHLDVRSGEPLGPSAGRIEAALSDVPALGAGKAVPPLTAPVTATDGSGNDPELDDEDDGQPDDPAEGRFHAEVSGADAVAQTVGSDFAFSDVSKVAGQHRALLVNAAPISAGDNLLFRESDETEGKLFGKEGAFTLGALPPEELSSPTDFFM